MNLRDALAVALHDCHERADGECRFSAYGFGYEWEGEHCQYEARRVLSDPTFREALVEAVAEALHIVQFDSADDHHDERDARAIVDRMLGDDMTLDLEAIRARDSAMGDLTTWPNESGNTASEDMLDAMQAIMDRRALLAEVDRLTLVAMDEGPYLDGQRHERARALPVIEAARALLRRSGSVLMTDAEQEDWAALRAALAEYDR